MIEYKIFEMIEFCQRWQKKADNYSNTSLKDSFDKFTTLYIIYNMIYRTLEEKLRDGGKLNNIQSLKYKNKKNDELQEDSAAIELVVNYLANKSESIISILTDEIKDYIGIITNNRFHFSIKSKLNDEGRNDEDGSILRNLESKSTTNRLRGLLTILYRIRCNLFHGSKGFFDEQENVLKPAINCLLVINNLLLESLNPDSNPELPE